MCIRDRINTTGQTICYNADASLICSTTAASGGDGTITYQWQSSILGDFSDAVTLASSNTATYDPGTLTQTTYFRRLAKDATCNTTLTPSTGVWKVTVYNQFTTGAINTTGQTICYNADASLIGSTTAASGGDGTITYKWTKQAFDELSETDILGS